MAERNKTKATKTKSGGLTLRPDAKDHKVIEKLCAYTGKKTKTGAIMIAVEAHIQLTETANRLRQNLFTAEQRLEGIRQVLKEHRRIASMLESFAGGGEVPIEFLMDSPSMLTVASKAGPRLATVVNGYESCDDTHEHAAWQSCAPSRADSPAYPNYASALGRLLMALVPVLSPSD